MSIEAEIGKYMAERKLTLATAESCTGGLVAHRITNVSGSSAYFLGGMVAYANEAKESMLGVRHETLLAHGAVSAEAAQEMAQGARRRLGADVALSITGIAGPTGGTADKPVGLVYVALSAADAELSERHVWAGDRLANKEQSAEAALQLLLRYLKGPKSEAVGESTATDHLTANQPSPGRPQGAIFEVLNEQVSVEVRVRENGSVLPTAFAWRSRRYQVTSWGRESAHTTGRPGIYCYLVQTTGPETWELCYDTETAQWTLARHWAARPQAV